MNCSVLQKGLVFVALLSSTAAHAYVLSPYKWGDPAFGTSGGTVTWGLRDSAVSDCHGSASAACTALSEFMPEGFRGELDRAFNVWSSVANIQFAYTADVGQAMIRMGGADEDGAGNVLAFAYYPTSAAPINVAGDVFFDVPENWTIDLSGVQVFWVALHEIGHAIGIQHSDVANTLMGAYYNNSILGLTADDIAAAQAIYGIAPPLVAVPLPPALWLLGSGLLFFGRRKSA